jgi:Zn-finger nucleic acid-binding protein
MKCPSCQEELRLTERSGIEIDYCPKCRGVWLDRGELDKLIDRSSQWQGEREERGPTPPVPPSRYGKSLDDSDYGYRPGGKPYKRESFLGRIFDWD